MENKERTILYDVIIVGAGPAGCSCALTLKDSNLKVGLFDKSKFPRDKVCGDAIPSRAINTLKNISPEFINEFRAFEKVNLFKKTRIFYEKKFFDFNWVGESYTCARLDFDNFLFNLVKKYSSTEIIENCNLSEIISFPDHIILKDPSKGLTYQTKILIGADGANSIVMKKLANRMIDRKHHVGSVRAYYSNISNTNPETTEVFIDKRIFPGYLWIFPLPDNKANVGYGMLSNEISKRKINLRKALPDLISSTPLLAERFKNAILLGDIEGFGLPLGSRKVQLYGDRFMLTGDAASLIDPISGEGIGNAMLSGKLAGEQILECFEQKDFSSKFISSYEIKLFHVIGTELSLRYRVQQIVSKMPFLISVFYFLMKNKWLENKMKKWF